MCGSKSESKQSTTNLDRRIGAAGGSQVAAEGSRIVTRIETVDPEIAESAFEEGFGFGKTALGGALAFGEKALEAVATQNTKAVQAIAADQANDQEFFEKVANRGSDELEGLNSLLSTTAIVGVAVAGVFLLSRS